jgi:hypothetical protein
MDDGEPSLTPEGSCLPEHRPSGPVYADNTNTRITNEAGRASPYTNYAARCTLHDCARCAKHVVPIYVF